MACQLFEVLQMVLLMNCNGCLINFIVITSMC